MFSSPVRQLLAVRLSRLLAINFTISASPPRRGSLASHHALLQFMTIFLHPVLNFGQIKCFRVIQESGVGMLESTCGQGS